jgi:hypothetical protein
VTAGHKTISSSLCTRVEDGINCTVRLLCVDGGIAAVVG